LSALFRSDGWLDDAASIPQSDSDDGEQDDEGSYSAAGDAARRFSEVIIARVSQWATRQ
jgi:hypothetical protein